ncbi:hypothetical protein [Bradyrhizobium sp. dw_78]|uniref:hypothetical protein n=1 Tax=Bradyrhizobium sp. dw_78 TaxID=2719793 RepID=UPI001BD200A1|nr:hypothetical protein [Bradyrhizobium sp. dw_78]
MQIRKMFAFSFVAAALLAGPAVAQTPYDGLWNVKIQTRTGSCEPSSQYPLTVLDGRVSGAGDVMGKIGREGIVKVSIQGVYASGQLNGNAGSGRWNGASLGIACSGRWEAARD